MHLVATYALLALTRLYNIFQLIYLQLNHIIPTALSSLVSLFLRSTVIHIQMTTLMKMGFRDKLKQKIRSGQGRTHPQAQAPQSLQASQPGSSPTVHGSMSSASSPQVVVSSPRVGPSTSAHAPTIDLPIRAIQDPITSSNADEIPLVDMAQSTTTATISLPRSLWGDAFEALEKSDKVRFQSIHPSLDDQKPWVDRITDLIDKAREKQLECDRKFWKFNLAGKEIILRDIAEKVIDFLQKFKAVGDVAIQFDPAHAALPWAGVRFLLEVQ